MFFWATLYLVLIFDIEIWYIIYYLELPQRMRFQRRLSEIYTVFFPILIHGAWHIRLFFLRQKIYRLFKVFEVVIEVSSCVGNPVFKQNCFLLDPMLLFYYIICLSVYYILCLSVCPFIFNKRENGWPNQTQILCGTSYEVREGLWMLRITEKKIKHNLNVAIEDGRKAPWYPIVITICTYLLIVFSLLYLNQPKYPGSTDGLIIFSC